MTNKNGVDLSQQDIIDNIKWTIARFKSYGIDIHNSSRFYKFYDDYLDLIRSNVFPDNMNELLEGMRDFFEIWQIAKSEEVLSNCKNELILLFGGTRMPSEDKINWRVIYSISFS